MTFYAIAKIISKISLESFSFLASSKRSVATGLVLLFFVFSNMSFGQELDTTKTTTQFRGMVTVTTNGISVIPSFSLGKPAVMFDLSVSGKRLSFDPQFRFALEGKPWSFIFWGRYKMVQTSKFQLNLGAHPAISFKPVASMVNGKQVETLVAKRFIAAEVVPTFTINPHLSLGIYYLHANGLDMESTKNTDFIALNTVISNVRLIKDFHLRVNPQVYYLSLDQNDGICFTSTVSLSKKNVPFTLSSIINSKINSEIPGKDFLWNLSLIYQVNKEYASKSEEDKTD